MMTSCALEGPLLPYLGYAVKQIFNALSVKAYFLR